jgi:hypothetical protein
MKNLITIFYLAIFLGFTSPSWATPLTFIYESTTNATYVGGSSTEAVTVTFMFDSDLLNGTGGSALTLHNGSYGPWEGTLRVGTETVALTGGTIEVFNNAGTTIINDGYDFRWDSHRGTSSGSLFGRNLDFFRILIVDDNRDMFSSVDLPTDPGFALRGDYIQDNYDLIQNSSDIEPVSFGYSQTHGPARSFTLSNATPVPEPATMLLFSTGIAGLAATRRRTKK